MGQPGERPDGIEPERAEHEPAQVSRGERALRRPGRGTEQDDHEQHECEGDLPSDVREREHGLVGIIGLRAPVR